MNIDHLVVGCADLDLGTEWLSAKIGVEPGGGGEHVRFGTHNRLWRLDATHYLELIACKPGADADNKALFGLGEASVQSRLVDRPRLLTWVARVESEPGHSCDALDLVPGLSPPVAVQRGDFRWQLAVEQDGGLCADGVLPYLIWWQSQHPTDALPETGLALESLTLSTPNTTLLTPLLNRLHGKPVVAVAGESSVVARIATPGGVLVLD